MSQTTALALRTYGVDAVSEALASVPSMLGRHLRPRLQGIALRVYGDTLANTNQFENHGVLRSCIFQSVTVSKAQVALTVGVRPDVFYARWLEFGTEPKDVTRHRGRKFSVGKARTEYRVRKGWHIRPHPFLIPAWQTNVPAADDAIEQAIFSAVEEFDAS